MQRPATSSCFVPRRLVSVLLVTVRNACCAHGLPQALRKRFFQVFRSKPFWNYSHVGAVIFVTAITLCTTANAVNPQTALFKQALTIVRAHQLDALRNLLKSNPELIQHKSSAGRLLHTAVRIADAPIADYLLSLGVDPDFKQSLDQSTPLHNASILKTTALVELLVAKGADVNANDRNGRSPIFRALELQRMDIVNTLFEAGADLNHVDALHSWTPLNLTVYEEKLTATRWLIEHGSHIDVVDKHGMGLLELAVQFTQKRTRGAVEIIHALRDAGLSDIAPAYNYLFDLRRNAVPRDILVEVDWLMLQQAVPGESYQPLVQMY